MNQSKLLQFWSVPIGEFYNPDHGKIKKDLINFFHEYEKKNPAGNAQLNKKDYYGNHDLYQSSYDLHKEVNNSLHEILKFIGNSILETVKKVNHHSLNQFSEKNYNLLVNLIETWFIRYNQGGFVYPHKHGSFSWSCVYYVQVGKEAKSMNGSTYFMKPYDGQMLSDFGSDYLKKTQVTAHAQEGKLIIFPGWLYHGSHPFKGEKDRIIISANSITELKK